MILFLTSVAFCCLSFYMYNVLWLRPMRIRKRLLRQGITGPKPSFFYGNLLEMERIDSIEMPKREEKDISHEFKLHPSLHLWRKEYGLNFVFLKGNIVTVYVTDPYTLKNITLCSSLGFGRSTTWRKQVRSLLGDSLVTENGEAWLHHRKIIAPEFFVDKVKGMVDLMVDSTLSLVKSWEARVEMAGGVADIKVDEDLRSLSADVIARACFGSSYPKGKEIFSKLRALQTALAMQAKWIAIPGFRYIPNKSNREIWRLDMEIKEAITKVIRERKASGNKERDLLNSILESNDHHVLSERFAIDNCKAIYLAGHDTTAGTAKWVLLLLALHPEWQARVRAEVAAVCGRHVPNSEVLRHMKQLTMVIQETMRLYSSAPFILKETLEELKFGGIFFPKGVEVMIPMASLHQDPENWGADAKEFNPERFAGGASRACKFPHLYMPFGFGPRVCLGQSFAMMELKIILSIVLSKFSFAVSPEYRHSVVHRLVLEPEFGVDLLVQRA